MAGQAKRKRDISDQGVQPSHPATAYSNYMSANEHEMEVVNALTGHHNHGADQLNDNNGRAVNQVDTAPMHFGLSDQQADIGVASYLAQAHQALAHEADQDPDFNIDPAVSERPPPGPREQEMQVQDDGEDVDKTNMTEDAPAETGESGEAPVEPMSGVKPKVGSEEWHAFRRSAHKDVERRRRETINEGINALARIVPGAERNNKGGILQRAVNHINELKDNQRQTEQKNSLERMMFEQSISELTNATDKLKAEVKELTEWKRVAESAGLRPESVAE